MNQIRINYISGGTFPINVYVSSIYDDYLTLLGTIDPGPVPPIVKYNITIPEIFNNAPEVKLTLIDVNNCKKYKILDCTFGCAFEIIVQLS
jgi:hypothetical protein